MAAFTFLSTPKYTATSELLATYRSSSGAAGSGTSSVAGELSSGASYINSQIQTYPQLVKTESVLQPVIDDLGLKTTVKELAATVTASNPSDTMLVDISVENVIQRLHRVLLMRLPRVLRNKLLPPSTRMRETR